MFSSLEACYTVKSSKRGIIYRHLSRYAFIDPSSIEKCKTASSVVIRNKHKTRINITFQ
jgi:hypothetical protein